VGDRCACGSGGDGRGGRRDGDTRDSIEDAGASAQWTTAFKSALPIEGLTGDDDGNLYVVHRGAGGCPILRIHLPDGTSTLVGSVPAPCGPAGLTFDAAGRL
jgi:hypothetical protein